MMYFPNTCFIENDLIMMRENFPSQQLSLELTGSHLKRCVQLPTVFLTSDFQKVQLFLQNLSLILTISNYCLCISVTLKKLFNERTDVIGFLQKISTHTDPSTGNQLCDAPGLTFALRLAAILLNSLHLQLGTESGTSSDEAGVEGCDVKMEGHTWKHYVDVISDLTEQLLVGAQQLSYWAQGSVRMAYFVAAKALVHHRCPSNVCQEAGKNKHSHMGRVVARPILVMGNKSIFFFKSIKGVQIS